MERRPFLGASDHTMEKAFHERVTLLKDEQERVQKKTFTNWMNTYLCQKKPPKKVENLFEEIKDGVVLLSLLEVLSGEKLPMEKGPRLRRPHHLANISTALNFLEGKKIKLVNINATSIADGRPSIVLGLVWTIILYFQIEETITAMPAGEDGSKKKNVLPKQSLLEWAENVLSKKYGLTIKDFGKSWKDGVAFNAMIHNIRPDLVDMDQIRRQQARISLEHAFSTAEDHLGIPRLLDPEDVDVEKPDEKSIMTYVAQFLKAYPDAGASGVPGTNIDTADKELQAYNSLMTWLNNDAKEIIDAAQEPVTDRESEFMDYLGFKTEYDRREPLYLKIGEKVLSGRALKISRGDWEKLDLTWQEVDEQVRLWLLKLDMALPGKLGKLGEWLYNAEKLMRKKEEAMDDNDKMAAQYLELSKEHRDFFKDLEEWKTFFAQVKRAGRYEGIMMHGPQIDHISKRLESVTLHSTVRQNRLDYSHFRYKILSQLITAENKVVAWTARYEKQESVEELLSDFMDYAERQKMLEKFDTTFVETKKAAETYKMGGADKMESSQIDHFLEEVNGRWKKLSVEVKSVRSMLEEVITTWKRYNACVEMLTVWLTDGEQAMTGTLEEKEEFFKDLAQYEDKHRMLNESANFLIEVSTDPVAEEIKQTVLLLNRRFVELVDGFQTFRQHEVIGKARTDYESGVASIESWLNETNGIMSQQVRCVHAELKAYLLELDRYNSQIAEVESNFKVTTKTAQSLVKDSSQEVVNAMLQTLNVQKETIVKLRKEIPERIKYLKAILPNVESLETGILDLDRWLDERKTLLDSHKLDGNPDEADVRLDRHKAAFTDSTYQKSLLESKNKVFQKIIGIKQKLKNVDFTPAEELMAAANDKFQNVISNGKEWERKLELLSRLWRNHTQRQQKLDEWLDNAEAILDDNEDDPESLIRKHKMFFDRVDKSLMSEYESNAAEILQQLQPAEQKYLKERVANTKQRWEHVHHHAPMKLLKLEFAIPEDKFEQSMEKAEIALQQQQDQIKRNQGVKEALLKHRQMFLEGNFVSTCEKCLDNMQGLSQQLLKLSRDEQSLDQRYKNHLERWKKLKFIADDTHLQLKQLPERWREYRQRMDGFGGWVEGVEKLMADMSQDGLSSEDYKDMLAKFQKEMRNLNKYQDDSKWLEKSLEELIKDAPDADAAREKNQLGGLLSRFNNLRPHMENTLDKSGILSKGYEYRDNMGKKSSWLDEAQRMAMEHPNIDSLQDARAYLHEHEALINKLESEKASIQAEIEAGKRLQRDKDAPAFIQDSINELDRKWKDTNELAKAKHTKLKQQVKDWENYEGEKGTLLTYLKKAEVELEKPLETLNQENAQKDFQSKKELQNTLNKLKGSLSEMTKLNKLLADGASRERQAPLKGEMTDIDRRLDNVSHRLNAKLTDLEATIAKWTEYYKRLNNFCDWLNEKEAKLNEIYENKNDSPDLQLQKAEGISSQVYENHVTLENLEKDARGLSQNFRSRETAALKSKLTSVRRQWESLCARAKDRSTALSGNVAHWQKYQNLHEQLMPWIMKAEKYCATDLPKCSSAEEAKDLYELHQAFLQECEENLPLFDQMNTEAGYLLDQPNMHKDLEAIQKRWGGILTNSEDRSHKVDKMYGAWTNYTSDLDNFQETLDRVQGRLNIEPNINTSDVQVLEHELALAKALQEEVRSHQPQLNALQRQFEQVQGHSSPEGRKVLQSKQDSIKSNWNEINEGVAERQRMLGAALQHRKNFYNRLQDTEKWVKKMQRKLDSGNEIYSDEVGDTQAKLKGMKQECHNEEANFQALQQEFKELISGCSKEEADILSERFDKLLHGYTNVEDLIGNREELCSKWVDYSDAQKDVQSKLKALQQRLASPDIKEEEVAQCMREIEALRRSMAPWSQEVPALDELMSTAQMAIKDRATQRTLHFGTELQALENLHDTVINNARQKEAQLGELTMLSSEFLQRKDNLVRGLMEVQEKIEAARAGRSDLQGMKDLVREIEDIRDDMYTHNPEYEQLRELGRNIMQTDPSKTSAIQAQLAQVNAAWEDVQGMLGQKHQQYNSVANMWQQYNDSKQGVMRIVEDIDPLVHQDLAFTNQSDVKKALDQHKNAEFDIHANQTQLDHMNSKGLQLLEDLKNIPDFDSSGMESDLDEVNLKWETANSVIDQHKGNLEAQLACWDQVQSGEEEVGAWVAAMVNKLDDSLKHFDDAVSVESRLTKFKEEAPYFAEVMAEVNQKLKDLKELNCDNNIPALTAAQNDIQIQFEKATGLANELESMMSTFSGEQQGLQKDMHDETEWMNKIKDSLAKCDDVNGTKEEIIKRFEMCKSLNKELGSHQNQIAAIQDKAVALHEKYPSSETSSLSKDAAVLTKKYESLQQRGDRIQESLLGQLEMQVSEAQQLQSRWLGGAREKANWCGDIAGDRYSVEAKLATIKDLEGSLRDGEEKRKEAINRFDAIKAILPRVKQGELDSNKNNMETDWHGLVQQLQQTRSKLEKSMDQWSDYDGRYEGLSQWLKETEGKLRAESALKPDLPSKKEQHEVFKSLDQSIQAYRPKFDDTKEIAQQITQASGDNRTASYAAQLMNRYQTLASAVNEQLSRSKQNISDHEQYSAKHRVFLEWLDMASQELEQCVDIAGDEDSLNTKLAIVQGLLAAKEDGLNCFNAALESGERLYPNTSNEGRENIRRELRSLRDSWESFNDSLNDTQRQLDSSRMQWSTFDENFEQLNKWVQEMDIQMEANPELKATLQEKKAQLQHCKTRCQDILSHQTMIDNISDKGTALASSQVQNKLKQLNAKYNALCNTAETEVKRAEENVDEHQLYQDVYQQCRDWMNSTRDKVAVCAEVGGDKQALQNRLDRLQDLMSTMKEGEAKIKSAHKQGEKTMQHTSPQGQANLRRELDSLSSDWDTLVTRMNDTQQGLVQAIKALDVYDGSCESLNRWLRETESQFKDCELKSSLREKEMQVDTFKSLQKDIASKQIQFDELQNMAAQVQNTDSRLAHYSNQLGTRYEALKNLARDVTAKWCDFVEEHESFQSGMAQSMEWVDTLRRRLQVCGDLAGDKQDVQDRLIMLQDLSAQRDEGSSRIHQTIENGERLYPNTASDGRDIIRQDIRNLRDNWEALRDETSEVQRKLDLNLNQWSSYDENFEMFQKWLLDMEVKLKEDTELKATLPDKKAQLQNHKVLHQDILSRGHIIENLSEKAQSLTQSTPAAKVNKFVGELKTKYSSICEASQNILDKFDRSMRDHQQYQDASQDFMDWLNLAREKLEACADRSGDKLSLKGKRERLKEFAANVAEGDNKLRVSQEFGATTLKNTSPQGRDILQRELDHAQREWEDYLNLMHHTEVSLEQTMGMWGDFESKFEEFAQWLKQMETQIKAHDLKNTLQEKEAQVDKFKRQREEILSHQQEIDRFTDDAQTLMHTSSDVRLSTQVSQLTNKYLGMLSMVKDLISKWEKYVQEHMVYDSRMQDFQDWMAMANQKLETCSQPVGDQESLEEKRALIQMLFTEKEHGHQKLNAAIEVGEKLYPDTAASGREKVRAELRRAKQEWENLFSGLNDAQRRVDSFLIQWSSYADGQDQLMRWMSETEAALRADVDLRNTLQEKRVQLQNHRSTLQDIGSHQRLVDSVIEKAQTVLKSTSNPDVADFITNISSRYEKLASDAENLIQRSNQHVVMHQQYQDSMQAAVDWMAQMKDKLMLCADSTGDKHTIQTKLDRLLELITMTPEGASKLKECDNHAQVTMDTTGLKGRQNVQQELEVLRLDWEDYSSKLNSLKDNLEQALHYWNLYESNYQQLSAWLKGMEKKVKECPLKSSLEEKQQQLVKYQELVQEIRGQQREMDKFTDEAQTLQQLTSETRVGNFVSQLSTRYQALLTAGKDLIKRCEQNVDDHKTFKSKYADSTQWLDRAKQKFSQCSSMGGSRAELEDRLDKVQDLVRERDAGFAKLNQCVEAGERLYTSTAPDGREGIRQDLRKLKLGYETLFDDLSAIQRKLEVSLVQWTSFDESYGQVEHWLRQMESQLEGPTPLRSTLEEKKTQLHNYKALQQDVLSYQRVIESISDKANTLVKTSSNDQEMAKFTTQTATRYKKLCAAAKERVSQYEGFVSDHQKYNDMYNSCVEWLNSVREKLTSCSDVSGDRHAIQSRLDKIQDILATKMEGEPKVKNVLELAQKVLPNTAPQGKDIVSRDTEALKDDWEAFIQALAKTKTDLESCMDQWNSFESWHERCAAWLKDIEGRLRDVDLKATLQEKQAQLDKLKALQTEVASHQNDLDSLSDAAQDLVRVSADSRVVSQASQLATKHQTATINIKELCRRWEQYVLDHQAYIQSFDQCRTWVGQMKGKVAHMVDTSGNKDSVQERLSSVQELLNEKEEGLHMLQIALDNLQIVLPNTSVVGRDNIRRDMQTLQQEFDSLSASLNDAKTQLDSTLAQWTVYDDSVEQLQRWLKELEVQVDSDSQLQNTLQEKKLQLERVKVLQLNISSQQSTIDSLNEKAILLKKTSRDGNLSTQIANVVDRYDKLVKKAKDLNERCEKNLRDHQIYRDKYMEASDWLGSAMDKLGMCSDVRGDRHAIEAQQHKVEEVANTMEAGKKKLQEAQQKGDVVSPQTSTQGQELIHEELAMLTTDYEGFESDLNDIKQTLGTLGGQWTGYEEFYEQLSHWIKDTENEMKADSDMKASLEQKVAQFNKHKKCHNEVLKQQQAFDSLAEQAQILMQSSTDGRVSTQLTQLSSRYSALITLSKDLLKRYEQTVQDHETFSEAFKRSSGWLSDTNQRLAVCADTSGDRYTIQTQLERLQVFVREFVVVKEEGQILLHTAVTWGEKAMANTSVEGREIIRSSLQKLQNDWDVMISQVTDTKVMLESCLLQWSDYTASNDQVIKWLKDMEKRLRDTQPKADLSEKKAELQRIKGMYQDIVSYEQMVESVNSKAADLAEKSPASRANIDTSQIIARYNSVKDQAKDLLARSEENVAHHQDFHDSCNSFTSWLRIAIEKLTTCSDTYGEKSAIETKIDKAKSLLANLSEGTQRLAQATKAGEATLPSTSASGQTKIRQELQAINRDFDEFRLQLVQAQSDLENCQTRWEEFESSYQEFGNWLRETEVHLRMELDPKATVEEKKKHWEEYQLYLEDAISHQSSLDRVSEKAQALVQTNADAKTSHAITQLTTRYHSAIALAKDITNNLEHYYNTHKLYKQNHHLFIDWLRETKLRLKTVSDDRGTRDMVHSKLLEVDEIQGALDQGHTILRTVLDSCEKTVPNTNQKGVHVIRLEADTAKADYENILTQVSQVKRSLEGALAHNDEFEHQYQHFADWLTETEKRLGSSMELKADLPEKRSSLEKYKAIQADINAHKDVLDRLEEKASHVKDAAPKTKISELRQRYVALLDKSRAAVKNVDEQVAGHEEYRKSFIGCLDWLANTKHRLQRLADYSGDKRSLQDRLHQLRDFKMDLGQGDEMMRRTAELGEKVCRSTSSRGQAVIQKEVDGLRDDWNSFSSALEDVGHNLEACIANWMELDDEQMAFIQWLERTDARLKTYLEPKANLARKRTQLQEGEDLYDDIMAHKSELNKVRDKGEAIAQRSSDMRVSNNVMQLSTKYQALTSSAKGVVSKLKENVHDHKLYDEALDSAATWLKLMNKRVEACSDSSGDWHAIQDRIEDIKDVTASMDEGLQKVNYVCDQAEKILPHTSLEGKKMIEEQVTDLTNDWEKLNAAIAECTAMLEGVQQRWHEYEQYYGSIVKWLADTENSLKPAPEQCAQVPERKTQLDKYKMILADVDNHRRLVNELADRVANLEALTDYPGVADSLADVQDRYSKLVDRAKDIVEMLQRGFDEHLSFQESQQDCEKWLLSMSYKLMSHNTMNVSSMELTNRQIDKHRVLLREIEDYRLTLDSVSRLGQQLILSNPRAPRLATTVQAQLTNLEESYLNLQSTAHQIRDRLTEILKKWQEYKELLDNSHEYLTDDFPAWLANADKNVPDTLDDAQKQREATQAELEKLYSMKQELQNSVRQCQSQNMGSTENLDKADEDVPSETAQFAEQVNSELNTCVNQAEKRLDGLRDTIKKWDSVDRMRHDIRQWLKKKQQDLQDLESQPAKVHSEAAELDVERFKAFQDEVKAKGPSIEELQSYYKTLTQHNPSSVDPVIRAIQDDYEDLLGQLDIIIHERQASMSQARALQAHQETMDEDLENYARELERIEMAEATVVDRSHALQSALPQLLAPPHQRRRCRSTQTVSPRNGSDSDDDGPAHSPWKSPRGGPRGRGGATGGAAAFPFPPSPLRGSRSGLPRSANTSRSNLRPRRNRHNESQDLRNFKKRAAAANGAGVESDSEESGYNDTFLETMHASSFDTHLDEPSYYYGSETQTPLTYIESDDESAASYVSGVFSPVDPDCLRDAGSQTPGHVRTQTEDPRDNNRSSMTQTENRGVAMYTSTTSLHSMGSQTKKRSGSRADLLKSILLEVKDIKKQQGIDDSDTLSIASDITVSREMLEQVYRDVSALRAAGAHGNAETQTINEQGTQTSVKLFPEGDPQQQARQGKLNEMLEEIRQLKGGNQSTTPSNFQTTIPDFEQRTPSRSLNRTTPARFESPMVTPAPAPTTPGPMTNGHDYVPNQQPNASMNARRRVTQDDLNNINDRLDRLANYQISRRQLPQPPPMAQPPYQMMPPPPQQFQAPPPVMFVPPPMPPSPRRYRVREFSRSYDDMEAMSDDDDDRRRRRRRPSVDDGVRDRYHLDDALQEATIASRQLKRLSSKMKRNLKNELNNHRL